jgi:hypothetical protein
VVPGTCRPPAHLAGHTALAYRFWHPRDHIFFQRRGSFGPGDRWHIVEAFGADRRFLLDQVFDVTKLDETGFTMEVRRLGHPVVVADERWRPTAAGLCWTVEMTVGSLEPGLRTMVRAVVRRRMAFLERWRQHNVEEAGNLPYFLPELYTGDAGS